MVMLQRLDAQLASLLEQRRKIQDELSSVQASINDEFDRVMRTLKRRPPAFSPRSRKALDSTRPVAGRLAEPEAASA